MRINERDTKREREAMMSPGMHKPPLAPKPKLAQPFRPGLSPSTPKSDDPLPPGTPRMVKPVLAPKPCLSKHTIAVESKPLASKSLHQTSARETPRTQGLLNFQQGVQQENKKTDWDYIIPICLCSGENCTCIKNTSASINKMDKGSQMLFKGKPEENKKLLPTSRDTTDNSGEKIISSSTHIHHANHLQTFTVDSTDTSTVTVWPPLPHRTGSNEANGNEIPQNAPGRGPEDDTLGSEQIYSVSQSKPAPVDARKHIRVPVPQKPRMAVLNHQEKEEERVESIYQEGRDMNFKEVKVSSEGKYNSSLSASGPVEMQPVFQSVRKGFPIYAHPSRKRPLPSVPAKALTSAAQVEEEDLGLDSSSHDMEESIKKDDDEVETEGTHDQEAVYSELTYNPPSSSLLSQQELSHPHAITVEAADVPVKVSPRKPQRHNSMIGSIQRKNKPSEEKEEGKLGVVKWHVLPIEDFVWKERLKRELSLPQSNKTSTPGAIKPARPNVGKQRPKSFSAADFIHSDGQKRSSFQKLLDLKFSAKMLAKLTGKGGQSPDCTANDSEQSVDRCQDGCESVYEHLRVERNSSSALIEQEQSVDGDEFSPEIEQEPYYENISYNEEMPIYMNVDMGRALTTPQTSSIPTFWPRLDDEGIYEEHEPYMSIEYKRCQSPTDCERSSVDEEVTPLDDGPSNYVTYASSGEEDDSSSFSSKGDPEQPEQSPVKSGQKKSKIHLIAKEIMSSESVFVDILKLLHVDFRDAVSKASRQNGKPVIEEHLLNEILYYLPQLYELNQDLLKELKHRVAKWDERSQLADIFLKKGPYLKMYSAYISRFDRNVTLLVEQSKRNPAFGAVVRDFEASPRCANLALKHYLLKPVQRIPQYQLLLTDYLKNLSEDSDDYNDTQAALTLVKDVASHANGILKQGDNFQKLMQVQCNLTRPHEIVQPGRIFLKEGILKKLSRKVMQPRMFFLFNDTLLHTIPVQSGQYKFKNMWFLAGMKVSKPSQEAYQNELNIETVERSFTLSASSATERDEWLEAISTAIDDFTKKKISFLTGKPIEEVVLQDCGDGTPLGSKAPIWIPDPRTTMCMICICEFTLTWRRHHCRACGKVVCQSCSSNKHCLEYRKNQLARVCDLCFLVLQQQKSAQNPSTTVSTGSRTPFAFNRKQKKIPAALKEVSANTNSSMSGYLQMSKNKKKEGKKRWFVIKDKVLYTYAASEDVAALESQPLLGFVLKDDSSQKLQFKLYHKDMLYYIFKAEDVPTAQRWIDSFREAAVL